METPQRSRDSLAYTSDDILGILKKKGEKEFCRYVAI